MIITLKGADFSENNIGNRYGYGWYTGYDVISTSTSSNPTYAGFAYANEEMLIKLRNKPINSVSVNILQAGTFTVGIVDSNNTIVDSVTVNVNTTGVQTIKLNKVLTAQDGERPFVQAPTDTAKFGYEMNVTHEGFPKGMDANVGVKATQRFANYNMNINFGYFG